MTAFLGAFLGALVIGILVTYAVRAGANRLGLVDVPDGERRLHPRPVPKAGGVAIYSSVMAIGAVLWSFGAVSIGDPLQVVGFVGGGTAMFLVGLFDDVWELGAREKFLLQTTVAVLVFAIGFRIVSFPIPGVGSVELSLWSSVLVTGVWIVGVTNAFNLIDGSDGVAGGAAVFALSTMAVVFALTGNQLSAVVSLILAGATLAFLFYNFPPATIFLGDSGSLFLGFSLAALGINSAQKAPTMLAVAIPVVAFGLPVIDTLLVIARRLIRGKPLHVADRAHIHHRLRELGHSPRDVALLLYGVCGFFSLLALVLAGSDGGPVVPLVLVLSGVLLIFSIQRLEIPEFAEIGRIVNRGLRQRQVIQSNLPIREAALHLTAADDPLDIAVALRYAFQQGEFVRVEIFVQKGVIPSLVVDPLTEERDGGLLWKLETPGRNGGRDGWELRYPIRDEKGREEGSISLWCSYEKPELLTDLKLIASEFVPALRSAGRRINGQRPEGGTRHDDDRIRRNRAALPRTNLHDLAVNDSTTGNR